MTKIDSHQHFWVLARGDYAWLTPELGTIYRDFGPAELQPQLANCGVSRTILVQAVPTLDETRYLLTLADEHDFITGVIGWVDLESAAAADDIATLATHPKFKGIRPMATDYRDDDWLARPELVPAFDALVNHGLRFEALLKTRHLGSLMTMMARHPELPVVINHAAKPDIASGWDAPWAMRIAEVAENTNAFCKFSGMVNEASTPVGPQDIEPYFTHIYTCFGADRLMWGSDWPVVKLRMEYGDWYSMSQSLLADLPEDERRKILCANAEEFYGL